MVQQTSPFADLVAEASRQLMPYVPADERVAAQRQLTAYLSRARVQGRQEGVRIENTSQVFRPADADAREALQRSLDSRS